MAELRGSPAQRRADAEVEAILFDPATDIVIKASRRRFFDGVLRRVIEMRDQFCDCGCGMPAEHCQKVHKVPYSKGGTTCQHYERVLLGAKNP